MIDAAGWSCLCPSTRGSSDTSLFLFVHWPTNVPRSAASFHNLKNFKLRSSLRYKQTHPPITNEILKASSRLVPRILNAWSVHHCPTLQPQVNNRYPLRSTSSIIDSNGRIAQQEASSHITKS